MRRPPTDRERLHVRIIQAAYEGLRAPSMLRLPKVLQGRSHYHCEVHACPDTEYIGTTPEHSHLVFIPTTIGEVNGTDSSLQTW